MEIVPFSDVLLKQRSVLLQKSLRPNCNAYPIESEYPIVLSTKNPQFSYCVTKNDRKFSTPKLIAHANLWPRVILENSSQSEFPVALVGNVATDSSYRGCGIMTTLFANLWRTALKQGFHALILWSDLEDFYQKLGFTTCGQEYRFCFSRQELKRFSNNYQFLLPTIDDFKANMLHEMLRLRPYSPSSLKRSTKEFKDLLRIPETIVLVSYENGELQSYFILGKGYDMIAVVHEWGAKSPDVVLGALKHIVEATSWEKIWLLSPLGIGEQWLSAFRPFVESLETHPLALAKFKEHSPVGKLLQESFIWGLDSI